MLLLMLVQHTKTVFMGMASIQVGEKKEKPKKNLFIWNLAHTPHIVQAVTSPQSGSGI